MQTNHHKSHIDDEKIVIYGNYKKIFTALISIMMAICVLLFSVSLGLKLSIANPDFYKNNLKKADTYSQIINDGIPSVLSGINYINDVQVNLLAKQAINYIIAKSISTQWVENETEQAIDKIADYVKNPKSNKVSIELNNFSLYLAQINDGLTIFEQIIPSCNDASNQNTSLKQLFGVSLDCEKMDYNLDDIKTAISKTKSSITSLELKNIDITEKVEKIYNFLGGVDNFAQNINLYLTVSSIIFILMLLCLGLLYKKDIKDFLRYLSYPLIASGFLMYFIGLFAKTRILTNLESKFNLDVNETIKQIIINFAKTATTDMFNTLSIVSIVIFVVGLLSYLGSRYIKK